MFARAASGTIIGVEARSVIVESQRTKGLPGLSLIGMARGAVREAVVRVRSAIRACDMELGTSHAVINLLPAELPKETSALDLALAVALLATAKIIDVEVLAGRRFFGELSLGGGVEPVAGSVVMADMAHRQGDVELLVPYENAAEAAMIPGLRVIAVRHLKDAVDHLCQKKVLAPTHAPRMREKENRHGCLSDVRGQVRAKRALEIAAAGGHNILLLGPPGSGKTMLARRLAGIMPPLESNESIEVTRIHSAAGQTKTQGLVRQRPFRTPHHNASEAALCGGGSVPRPGEITLAHRGILFLDEFPEFSRRALESLREPLEEGRIHVARSQMTLTFPAQVHLVAAMNPCPCGRFRGDLQQNSNLPTTATLTNTVCLCTFEQIKRYRARISGPLLDRIGLHVLVDAIQYSDFLKSGDGESSAIVSQRVLRARRQASIRLGTIGLNARMNAAALRKHVPLQPPLMLLIEDAIMRHGLSARAIDHCLRVARTIADLAQSPQVTTEHLQEAFGYRLLGRSGL